jgi:hypothetical protein
MPSRVRIYCVSCVFRHTNVQCADTHTHRSDHIFNQWKLFIGPGRLSVRVRPTSFRVPSFYVNIIALTDDRRHGSAHTSTRNL